MELNQTPVRTSRNFNMNNTIFEEEKFPKNICEFKNLRIISESRKR